MENYWPLNNSGQLDRYNETNEFGTRPLLGRLLLMPNQQIIQEQYEANQQMSSEATNMNRTSYFSQNPSFKEFGMSANMRNETDYLLAPEHRRFSSTSNESERSSVSEQSEFFHNDVFSVNNKSNDVFSTNNKSNDVFSTNNKSNDVFSTNNKSNDVFSVNNKSNDFFSTSHNSNNIFCISSKSQYRQDSDSVFNADFWNVSQEVAGSNYKAEEETPFSSDSDRRRSSAYCSDSDRRRSSAYSSDSDRRRSSAYNFDCDRRRSSAYTSDSDRSSWRMSGSFSDRRHSRMSTDSRRDSEHDQSSSSLWRNSFTKDSDINQGRKTSGMELVPVWLKLLRLHKYTDLIMALSYHEMIHLTDEQLESQGVTKGARRKILNNIQKLVDRPRMLEEINLQLDMENCNIKKVLVELEVLLKSPVKIGLDRRGFYRRKHDSGSRDSGAEVSEDEYDEGGSECEGSKLVNMIMATMKKTCSLLLLSQHTDGKQVSHFVSLLDTCLTRDCYSQHQKQLLNSWKHKLCSIWNSAPAGAKKSKNQFRHSKEDPSSSSSTSNNFPISHWTAREKKPKQNYSNKKNDADVTFPDISKKRLSLQNMTETPASSFQHRYSLPLMKTGSFSNMVSVNLDPCEVAVEPTGAKQDESSTDLFSDTDIDTRLKCLCLSVTKNALD